MLYTTICLSVHISVLKAWRGIWQLLDPIRANTESYPCKKKSEQGTLKKKTHSRILRRPAKKVIQGR